MNWEMPDSIKSHCYSCQLLPAELESSYRVLCLGEGHIDTLEAVVRMNPDFKSVISETVNGQPQLYTNSYFLLEYMIQ